MKVKLFEGGIMPKRAHFDDAGIDFFSPADVMLRAHDSVVIDLRVGVQIPIGYWGKMESKSGLNVNENIQCTGGVIDSGFRGSVRVRMTNNGHADHFFRRGDKVVQMVLVPVLLADLEQVDTLDPSQSGRNESGWGSTGR